jgi:hypothetical protein
MKKRKPVYKPNSADSSCLEKRWGEGDKEERKKKHRQTL